MRYDLVIKTNSYTGNFEREMCAFLTGMIGECEVGENMAELLIEEEGIDLNALAFENAIELVADEHGCYRPVSLDERDSKNLIIYFHTKPTTEQINHIKKYAPMFDEYHKSFGRLKSSNQNKPVIEILGYELRKHETITQTTVL